MTAQSRISVWLDTTSDPTDPAWIVSRDHGDSRETLRHYPGTDEGERLARAYALHRIMDTLETAYDAARGEWDGADWRHEYGDDYCEGGTDGCPTCEAAERDAARARAEAEAAMEDARRGDWSSAVQHAEAAARLERHYGDAPVWGPFAREVRDARAKVGE